MKLNAFPPCNIKLVNRALISCNVQKFPIRGGNHVGFFPTERINGSCGRFQRAVTLDIVLGELPSMEVSYIKIPTLWISNNLLNFLPSQSSLRYQRHQLSALAHLKLKYIKAACSVGKLMTCMCRPSFLCLSFEEVHWGRGINTSLLVGTPYIAETNYPQAAECRPYKSGALMALLHLYSAFFPVA